MIPDDRAAETNTRPDPHEFSVPDRMHTTARDALLEMIINTGRGSACDADLRAWLATKQAGGYGYRAAEAEAMAALAHLVDGWWALNSWPQYDVTGGAFVPLRAWEAFASTLPIPHRWRGYERASDPADLSPHPYA